MANRVSRGQYVKIISEGNRNWRGLPPPWCRSSSDPGNCRCKYLHDEAFRCAIVWPIWNWNCKWNFDPSQMNRTELLLLCYFATAVPQCFWRPAHRFGFRRAGWSLQSNFTHKWTHWSRGLSSNNGTPLDGFISYRLVDTLFISVQSPRQSSSAEVV